MRLVGFGAGGHAKVMIDVLQRTGGFDLVGLIDPRPQMKGAQVLGVPVLGDDSLLASLHEQGVRGTFIGVGGLESTMRRSRLYDQAKRAGFEIVTAIHPDSSVAASAELGAGLTVMARAVVNPAARLGDDVTVNSGAVVEHECVIGDHVHVAPAATLGGGMQVGDHTLIGVGATVRPHVRIGRGALVGAGAVVVEDVPDQVVMAGVPAKIFRRIQHDV